MKNRERWLETLYDQYAWLLDEFGVDSPLAGACLGAYANDPEARAVLGEARLLKDVLGSANPDKWRIKKVRNSNGTEGACDGEA